jgi:plastocyanin
MKQQTLFRALLAAILCAGCGGGGGATPASPAAPTTSGGNQVITITIKGQNGVLSFSPNPAMCATGQTVVWKNGDTITHHVTIDDLGITTGDLAPGETSKPFSLSAVSKSYHCVLHPTMVGAINDAATPDPKNDPYCDLYGC